MHQNRSVAQQGIGTLMGAMFMVTVIMAMLLTLLQMTGSDVMDVAEQDDGITALFLAESAIEQASGAWDQGTDCVDLDGAGAVSFGAGSFTVDTATLQADGKCRLNVTGAVRDSSRKLQADVQLGCTNTGWSVGASGTIAEWDSSSWSVAASPVSVLLNDVHCVRKTEAWAVGSSQGRDITIY
ncbi:MAG: hypothetical protein HN842_00975, partial [Gammaproteobacteria bacterium]|nr:hypothetical protein [Gammaproteobacteria bacterium]MBT7306755.1 hypothetical protein [Gammaproteobacteria bacterium]